VKLADSVGHIRVATNFAWTLNTGYLVLFMQAGFALLTCGLVRKKNAGHLMMLNFAAYVFAFLAYYAVGYAFQFGAVAVNAAPGNLGGTPTLNHFLIGNGLWGFLGGNGFFMSGPAYDAGSNCLALFEVVFMETAGYIIVGRHLRAHHILGVSALRAIHRRHSLSGFRLLGVGRRMVIANRNHAAFGPWLRGFRGVHRGARVGGFCAMALAVILGPRLGKYGKDGKPRAFPAHNLVYVVTGHFHSAVRLDGFQSRLDAGRHRPAHFRDCHQHEPGRGGRFGDGPAALVLHVRQAGCHYGLQRDAGRLGGDHRSLRFRVSEFGGGDRGTGRDRGVSGRSCSTSG
jgi:ammonium transporter, Amt family